MAIQKITSGIIADGAIVATDIADGIVTNAKLAGSITSDKITSVSNTAIAGLIQSAQIGSVSNTALSGVIEVSQLADTLNLASKTVTLPAGVGGKVLQVVSSLISISSLATTSDSYQNTGLNVTITPTSASNKVIVMASGGAFYTDSGEIWLEMFRNIGGGSYSGIFGTPLAIAYGSIFTPYERGALSMNLVDSPNTTSEVNYKMMYRSKTSGETSRGFGPITMIAMEIAA